MRDLHEPKWMYAKAAMFVLIGLVSSALIVAENFTLETCVLLGLSIWGFSRAYYFAFYVIERYVDPSFKFSGLWAAFKYIWRRSGTK